MLEFYERVSGARMHAAYIRPGGVAQVMYYKAFQFSTESEGCDLDILCHRFKTQFQLYCMVYIV